MARGTKEQLIALLRAQRAEAGFRSSLQRQTPEWSASSDRLGRINDEIMHLGLFGTAEREPIGDGLELDLDSYPVDDRGFRQAVVAVVRHAVAVATRERLARRSRELLSVVEDSARRTAALIARSEVALRSVYPEATISTISHLGDFDAISLRADRDGRVA